MSILVSSISVPFQKGEAAAIELALRPGRGEKAEKCVYCQELGGCPARLQ